MAGDGNVQVIPQEGNTQILPVTTEISETSQQMPAEDSLSDVLTKGKFSTWSKAYSNDLSEAASQDLEYKGKDSLNVTVSDGDTSLNIDVGQTHDWQGSSSGAQNYNNTASLTQKTDVSGTDVTVGVVKDLETGEVSPVVKVENEYGSVGVNDGMKRAPSSKAMFNSGGGQNGLTSEFEDIPHKNVNVTMKDVSVGDSTKVSAKAVYDTDNNELDAAITTKIATDRPVEIDVTYNGNKDVAGVAMSGKATSDSTVTAYYQDGVGEKNSEDFVAGMTVDTKYDNGMRTEVGAAISNKENLTSIEGTLTMPVVEGVNVQAHLEQKESSSRPNADIGVYATYKF